MAISWNSEKKIFSLHTENTTYQFKIDSYGYLLHLYYGKRTDACMDYMITHFDRGFSGNPFDAENDRTYSLDALPQEFPMRGTGDYRNTALAVRLEDGSRDCDLRFSDFRILEGKYALEKLPAAYSDQKSDAQTLEIDLKDSRTGLLVTLLYGVIESCDIITRSLIVKNIGTSDVTLERVYSACLDFIFGKKDCISFYGRHAMERNMQRIPVSHGSYGIGSRRGTSSHQYNPLMILADPDTTETAGNAWSMSFVYSGGFDAAVELDQFDQTRMLMGLSGEQFSYSLSAGEQFTAPEVIMTYSASGLGKLSRNLHRCIQKHICRGKYRDRIRPVLINSWEACYFDFDADKLLSLSDKASELGIEMLVLDDGWFGNRSDDNSSLGDWYVNEEKLGCSLKELVTGVHEKGLQFGIWVEPEMISIESDLYRKHPDWALTVHGKNPVLGRNQLVLDFSNPEVVDYMFESMSDLLSTAYINYVKWDMNRSLSDIFSNAGTSQGKVLYNYVIGLYGLLERLTSAYPDVLWEGCSGGGGRFDAGMMYYTPQIWCSDNTDAVDRTRIQYGTSFGYPMSVTAAHVSAVPNHQTGRKTDMYTRGVTAMTGAFGYELDLNALSEEEQTQIREQVRDYKRLAPLVSYGDYYRLSDPFADPYSAWMSVNEEKEHALVSLVRLETHGNDPVSYIKLQGLDPASLYKETVSGRIYAGDALMEAGIPVIHEPGDYRAYRWEFKKYNLFK